MGPRVIVALDYATAAEALAFAQRLDAKRCRVKVGKELFTVAGPALVEQLVGQGLDVFLDLKYHDIPNTVAAACKAAAGLGVWMINVHAAGGRAMMQAASEALAREAGRPRLIAVTVLTSMGAEDLRETGQNEEPAVLVGAAWRGWPLPAGLMAWCARHRRLNDCVRPVARIFVW